MKTPVIVSGRSRIATVFSAAASSLGRYAALPFAIALPWMSSASAVTVTFNTPGTTNWTCPAGVTEIQVECWGGGGAGGAGTKINNTGQNTIQNGGGGGGGGYARRVSVPVTPGQNYTITIPAAAVSGTNGLLAANIVSGGAVSFTGDASVTVTANGGVGGRNAYVNGANAASSGSGGAAGAGTSGDVVKSGGVGANGTTGGGNVSGGGGGGAGDTTNGSNGSGANGGAGGVAGGGVGGDGSAAGTVYASRTDGTPGATPGGGGGGAHNLGQSTYYGGTGGLGQIVISYPGPDIVKDDNIDDLNLTTSWVGGAVPTSDNVAKWDATVLAANTTVLGADATWAGIEIVDPAGLVTIGGNNILTLGEAQVDLDLSAATQDLVLNCDLILGGSHVWDVASPQTLTLNGEVSGSSSITIQGDGTTVLSGDSTYTGNTIVNDGTLNLTGSLTGNGTTTTGSALRLGAVAGDAVMNITGDIDSYLSFNGGSASGANTAINMSSGTLNFTYTGSANNLNQVNSAATGSYGSLNLTGGIINTVGRTMVSAGAGGGAAYIGGTGTLNATGDWFMVTHVNANALGSLTIGPGGTLNRAGAPNPTGIFLTAADQYGILNVTGGNLIISAPSLTTGVRFGNGNNGNNCTGFLNLAAGMFETNANVFQNAGTSTGQNAHINLAGGTLKATGNLTALFPSTVAGQTVTTTMYGPIDNDGTAQDFTGGFTVDTNGNSVTSSNPLIAPSADGVARSSLTITGGSGYIGAPVVQFTGGTLDVGGAPAAGYAVVSGGAVTDIVITAPGSYTVAPSVTLTGGGGAGASVTVGSLVPNTSGGLTKVGEGTLVLSGPNTYSGATLVSAGDLKFSTAGSGVSDVTVAANAAGGALVAANDAQFVSTGDLTLDNSGALLVDYGSTTPSTTVAPIQVDNFTVGTTPGVILEAASLSSLVVSQAYPLITWTGTGPIDGSAFSVISHRGSLNGTFSVSANTLFVTITVNGPPSPISWNTGDGTWDTVASNWVDSAPAATTYVDPLDAVIFGDAAGASGNPAITLDSVVTPVSVTMNSTSHDYTITGTGGIGGSGGLSLDAANTKTLSLATANTYSGATAIAGGTLSLGNGGSGGSINPASAISIASGATLAVNQDDTVTQGTEFSGAALDGAGGFTQAGSGATVLNVANTYTGITNVTSGTLTIANASALGTNAAGTVVASGARVFASGAMASQTVAEAFTITGNGINATSGAIHFGGGVAGVDMSGAVTLAGDSTIKNDGSTSTTFSGGIGLGSNTLTFSIGGGGTNTISTNGIGGNGSVIKDALTGTMTFNTANSYTGTTTVSGGTLSLGDVNALSTTTGLTLEGGTLLRPTIDGVVVNAPITIGTTGTDVMISAPTNLPGAGVPSTVTLGGAIGGNGNVVFTSSVNQNALSTVLLNAQSTYVGSTLIDTAGTTTTQTVVKLGTNNALPTTTVVTMDGQVGAGTGRRLDLDLNGFSQEIAGLTNVTRSLRIQRVINSNAAPAATLTVNNSSDYTYSGRLGNAGPNFGLTKNGSAVFTANGTLEYSGNTTVTSGTLSLGSSNSGNDLSTVTIASSGATLDLAFAGTDTVDQLFIGATQMAAGEYGNISSVLPVIGIAEITGTGTLTVTTGPPVAGYSSWATVNGAGANLEDDHDGDGVSNGIEYFLGGPNGNTTGFTALPGIVNTAGTLSITWPKGSGYAGDYQTDFVVETSATLSGTWTPETLAGGNITDTATEVTYTFPGGPPYSGKNFARLRVTGP